MEALDSLSAVFFQELKSILPDYERFVVFSDRPELVIPAKHPETGELHVWLDDDEITIGIGESFHTHCCTYFFNSDDRSENEREAAREAVAFIRDVLADKVVVHVSSRITGSYHRGSADAPSLKPGVKECTWSGPFLREG